VINGSKVTNDKLILDLRFSPLMFNVKLRLSGSCPIEYRKLSVSANIAVVIVRATSYWIAANASASPISFIISTLNPLPVLRKTTKIDQPIHNLPEDGNCNL
jgi:hypothetical protein